jgi:pimeloyl-ACP methyl ester carboxylesterase
MMKLIPMLTDPKRYGGRTEDAFDVVPSLPGYGFSSTPTDPGMNPQKIAALWAQLTREPGYERFSAQGGDWGSIVSICLGLDHPDRIIGIHLNYIAGRFLLGGSLNVKPQDEVASAYLQQLRSWWGGYSHERGPPLRFLLSMSCRRLREQEGNNQQFLSTKPSERFCLEPSASVLKWPACKDSKLFGCLCAA